MANGIELKLHIPKASRSDQQFQQNGRIQNHLTEFSGLSIHHGEIIKIMKPSDLLEPQRK